MVEIFFVNLELVPIMLVLPLTFPGFLFPRQTKAVTQTHLTKCTFALPVPQLLYDVSGGKSSFKMT